MNPLSESESSQSGTASPPPCTAESFLPETAAFRKSRHLLSFIIDALLLRHGVDHTLFVTLTLPRCVRSTEVGHDKLNSLLNAVRKRYGGYLWVLEPHKSGGIHFHLLVPVDFDCHTGTYLEAWSDKFVPIEGMPLRSEDSVKGGVVTRDSYQRNSMNPALRAEADWWRDAAKAHGFGRVQVAPIYGGAEAIRKYMTKQNWRTRPWPFKERKHVRFWSCSRDLRAGTVKFAWNTPRARQGREQMAAWAKGYGCESLVDLPCVLGSRWGNLYMREMVWCVQPKGSAEIPPPATCPFPLRRYSDPDFCWHPGLYASAKTG